MANKGQQFETRINRIHRHYQSNKLAWTWHTYPPFLIERRMKNGRFNGRLMGEAPPDYLVFSQCRFFMIEAKSCSTKNRFPLANIARHQRRQLENVTYFGGMGLMFIRSEMRDAQWLVDWRDLELCWSEWRKHELRRDLAGEVMPRGVASVPFDDLAEMAIFTGHGSNVDYLKTLLSHGV
jgi:recombination protein U